MAVSHPEGIGTTFTGCQRQLKLIILQLDEPKPKSLTCKILCYQPLHDIGLDLPKLLH